MAQQLRMLAENLGLGSQHPYDCSQLVRALCAYGVHKIKGINVFRR